MIKTSPHTLFDLLLSYHTVTGHTLTKQSFPTEFEVV